MKNTNTSERKRSPLSIALVRVALVAGLVPFIAAPTPGNIGGCSTNLASQRVVPSPGQTEEYAYFDQGLCAHFCMRLLECSPETLCASVERGGTTGVPDDPATCIANPRPAYEACVRGQIAFGYFGISACPHSCPRNTAFQGATQWDVQTCGDAIMQLSCEAGRVDGNGAFSAPPGSIGGLFLSLPSECSNPAVCRDVSR